MSNKHSENINFLIAGAGGMLGKGLVDAFFRRGIKVSALGFDKRESAGMEHKLKRWISADVTKPQQLSGVCDGIDVVISCIGITRMKGKFTHMNVDYLGNLNLLREAKKSKVKKFSFISPAGTDRGRHYAPLLKAKYLFEEELKRSGLDWLIFRSGGFFTDLAQMRAMAEKGALYLIGKGAKKFTPIEVGELAEIMAEDCLCSKSGIVEVGGPEDLSWKDIYGECCVVSGKKAKVIRVPVWMCKFALALLRPFSPKHYAMGRLILFTSVTDLTTAKRGKVKFSHYLRSSQKNG